jgi:hypothetical protein
MYANVECIEKSVHNGVVEVEVKLCGKEVKISAEKHLFRH